MASNTRKRHLQGICFPLPHAGECTCPRTHIRLVDLGSPLRTAGVHRNWRGPRRRLELQQRPKAGCCLYAAAAEGALGCLCRGSRSAEAVLSRRELREK